MMKMTPRATAHRAVLNFSRVMFKGAYGDKYMMQQFEGSGMKGAGMANIERAQDYGFRSVPHAPGTGEGSAGWGPMGYATSHGGNPSHQIVSGVEDPRHTPYKMPEGSSFQYSSGGIGTFIHPKLGSFMMAGGHGEDKDKQRASLRHVTKEAQPRKLQALPGHGGGGGGGSASGGQQQGQQDDKYAHQGSNPSSEIFTEKDGLFATAVKNLLHEHSKGLYTLIDDKHVAMFASKELVAWVDKDKGLPLVTKPWQVQEYSHKKPSPTSKDQEDSGGSGTS
jgi:hypothetical protein